MRAKRWTPEEDSVLIKLYPEEAEAAVIAERLGRSLVSIYLRARVLGLRKPETFRSLAGRKVSTCPESISHRFAKGHIPANKGLKMSPAQYAKAAQTMFRKDKVPVNHRPVGSEMVNVDGYVEIKVAEPNRWKLKHRILWEEANGPIPRGYNIQFRDGNRQNTSLDNLYIISRAEQLLTQNGMVARYPAELVSAIRVKAGLKRQITIYNKKHYEQ